MPEKAARIMVNDIMLAKRRGQNPAASGQRNLNPDWWAPRGIAAIPNTALDPPRSAASPAVPALHGSGSPP